MWPFKKKEQKQKEKSWETQIIEELRQFRDMGDKFTYLGIEMIVCGHYQFMPSSYGGYYRPCLRADYVDKHGRIQNIEFACKELGTLRAENL